MAARRKPAPVPGEWVDTMTKEDWANRAAWSRELARQAGLREQHQQQPKRRRTTAGEEGED